MVMSELSLVFDGNCIPYDVFKRDLASEIIKQLKDSKEDKEIITQNEAYRIFGRANVMRWKKLELVKPAKKGGRIQYVTAELRHLQNKII